MIKEAFRSYTFRSTFALTVADYSVKLLGFVFVILAFRKYDADGYGGYVLMINYLNLIGIVNGFGLITLINSKVAEDKANSRMLPAYFISCWIFLVVAGVVLKLAKPSIPGGTVAFFVLYSGLYLALGMRFYQRQLHKRWAVLGVVQSLLVYAGLLGGMALGAGVETLTTVNYAARFLFCVYLAACLGGVRGIAALIHDLPASFRLFGDLAFGSGKWLMSNLLVNKVLSETLPILLGEFISKAFLGTYDMIFKISALFGLPIYTLEGVITSRHTKANIREVRRKYLNKVLVVSCLLSTGTFATILVVYQFALGINLETKFLWAAACFALTVATLGHRVFNRALFTILEGTRYLMWNNLVSTVFHFGGMVLMLKFGYTQIYQIAGLHLATVIVSSAMYEFNYSNLLGWLNRRNLEPRVP